MAPNFQEHSCLFPRLPVHCFGAIPEVVAGAVSPSPLPCGHTAEVSAHQGWWRCTGCKQRTGELLSPRDHWDALYTPCRKEAFAGKEFVSCCPRT